MITIKQQTELSFHHIDVKDAVVMAKLMNKLALCIAQIATRDFINNLPGDEKVLYNKVYPITACIDCNEAKDIFNILSAIGFVATEEYSPEDILSQHLKKD